MSNYLTYPFKTMNLSQGYRDGNHIPHWQGAPADYPIDEAGADTGRDYFYCPCNEMKVTKMYGDQKVGRHIWLESTSPVDLANGKRDYVTVFAVHLESDDWVKLKVGQTFKRGQAILREGMSGKATGNHVHMAVGIGFASKAGFWKQNSKGVWVLVTSGGPLKPEEAFFVDPVFTTIKNAKGVSFKTVAQETKPVNKIIVGGKVRITGLKYATGGTIPAWVKGQTHVVSQIKDGKALLGANGGINSWVLLNDLVVV